MKLDLSPKIKIRKTLYRGDPKKPVWIVTAKGLPGFAWGKTRKRAVDEFLARWSDSKF